jgi:hypothetical protein
MVAKQVFTHTAGLPERILLQALLPHPLRHSAVAENQEHGRNVAFLSCVP